MNVMIQNQFAGPYLYNRRKKVIKAEDFFRKWCVNMAAVSLS